MENYGKFGYWHWALSFAVALLVGTVGSTVLTAFFVYYGFISTVFGLWIINTIDCALLVLTRYLWVKSSCKRYASSSIYRVYTYVFACFLAFGYLYGQLEAIHSRVAYAYKTYHLSAPVSLELYPYTALICMAICFAFSVRLINENKNSLLPSKHNKIV